MSLTLLLPSLEIWLICATAVAVGTGLQRLSGAGFGMLATPVMTLVAESYIPGTILLLGCVIGISAALSSRAAIVSKDLGPGFLGRTVGAILAAFIATAVVGSPALPVLVGCLVLLAVGLSLAGLSVEVTPRSLFVAGTAGGLMGTLTGVGAPPMAILYSTVEPRRSAASQNAFFGFGMVVSIIALATADLIGLSQIAFALSLAPMIPLGLLAARPLAARVERSTIRPWALGLSTLAASVLLLQSV